MTAANTRGRKAAFPLQIWCRKVGCLGKTFIKPKRKSVQLAITSLNGEKPVPPCTRRVRIDNVDCWIGIRLILPRCFDVNGAIDGLFANPGGFHFDHWLIPANPALQCNFLDRWSFHTGK